MVIQVTHMRTARRRRKSTCRDFKLERNDPLLSIYFSQAAINIFCKDSWVFLSLLNRQKAEGLTGNKQREAVCF